MSSKGSIVVTGASSGIGAACALGLASRGYGVFAGVRKPDDAKHLEGQASGDLVGVILDVTDPSSIDAARRRVEDAVPDGALQGLFNNAGISINGPLEFITPEDMRKQLEVNVVGQLAVTQAFLPMLRKGKGRIVNTGSVGGFVTTPILGPYCMSKYAMEAFSDALRLELQPQGISVSLLEPAAIKTEIWGKGTRDAKVLVDDPPAGLQERYGSFVAGIQKFAVEGAETAADPKVVLEAVIHALEADKPKTRYIMGTGAGQRRFLRLLPDRLRDRLLLKALGVG